MRTSNLAIVFSRFTLWLSGAGAASAAFQHHWGAEVGWLICAIVIGLTGWPETKR